MKLYVKLSDLESCSSRWCCQQWLAKQITENTLIKIRLLFMPPKIASWITRTLNSVSTLPFAWRAALPLRNTYMAKTTLIQSNTFSIFWIIFIESDQSQYWWTHTKCILAFIYKWLSPHKYFSLHTEICIVVYNCKTNAHTVFRNVFDAHTNKFNRNPQIYLFKSSLWCCYIYIKCWTCLSRADNIICGYGVPKNCSSSNSFGLYS